MFCGSTGTPWSYQNACRELMKVCRKLEIDLGGVDGCFHAFRRKFARNYVKCGGNVIYLQQVMGHSSLQTTRSPQEDGFAGEALKKGERLIEGHVR